MSEKYKLVGCCGIYCGACFAYRRSIAAKAEELKEVLEQEKFRRIATAFDWIGDYKEFSKWLRWLVKLTCNGCQTGGGNPYCSIRRCCKSKGYLSCAECPDMPCKKLEWITRRYKKWNLKNLKFIKSRGYDEWIEEMEREVERGFKTGDVIAAIERPRASPGLGDE